MSNTDDWDAVPVAGAQTKAKPSAPQAAQSSQSNTSDWDAVPIKGDASLQKRDAAVGMIKKEIAKQVIYNLPPVGAAEAGANMATSMIAKPVSDVAGLAAAGYDMLTGNKDGDAEGFKRHVQESLTYEPRGQFGKAVAEYNPISMIGKGWGLIGKEAGDAIKTGNPGYVRQGIGNAVAEAIPQAVGILGAKAGQAKPVLREMPPTQAPPVVSDVPAYVRKAQAEFERKRAAGDTQGANPQTPPGTTGTREAAPTPAPIPQPMPAGAGADASKLSRMAQAAGVSDALQSEIGKAESGGDIHAQAAQRHIEAESLPVPMKLTAGEATGDVNLMSHERNMRGKYPELAEHFNGANKKLAENIEAIRDQTGPDVYHDNHVESGQSLIDSYKAKDAELSADISSKYKALEDANGGQFPVNGKAFVEAADAALSKKMKGRYVPPEIQADMQAIREGGPMTYEMFENMRTNLAAESRKAERAGDGNRAMATSLVRDALESIPITEETAALKPLADAARSAAKARFDLIKNDPAYKAAINDSVSADKFLAKHVVKASVKDVKTMQENLAHDPVAGQTIASGAVNYLKDRAMGAGEKFKQNGYNTGLKELRPKLDVLMKPEQAQHLENLGKVARYTQEQPEGAYVNNSNTAVQQAASAAKAVAQTALDVKTLGATKLVRHIREKALEKKEVQRSLKPGAGVKISDFPKSPSSVD